MIRLCSGLRPPQKNGVVTLPLKKKIIKSGNSRFQRRLHEIEKQKLETVLAQAGRKRRWIMTTLELTLNLPDDLAQKAQRAGLLTPQAMEAMLREQLRKQAGETLRNIWARLPHEELTPEIEQEIVTKVRSVRAAQRKKSAS